MLCSIRLRQGLPAIRCAFMSGQLKDVPDDVRRETAAALRAAADALTTSLGDLLPAQPPRDAVSRRTCAQLLVDLLAAAIEGRQLDGRNAGIRSLAELAPPLSVRHLIEALQKIEPRVVEGIGRNPRLGASSPLWPGVSGSIRSAVLEIVAAYSERDRVDAALHDSLTTLLSRQVFDLVLTQELERAHRHRHGVALILFDIDDLTSFNRSHGYGAGDRLLERLGILAGHFFRTHDWVARHGGDSIAVLLPEATIDQAAALAYRFCQMVRQRLVLVDHKTEVVKGVTVSAGAAGTDFVQVDAEPALVLREAETAVRRAALNGGNRIERVGVLPASVTIPGAATLLGVTPREVVRFVRSGALVAARRGRHLHVERAALEAFQLPNQR